MTNLVFGIGKWIQKLPLSTLYYSSLKYNFPSVCPSLQSGIQCSNCIDGYFGDPFGLNGLAQTCQHCNCHSTGSLSDICSNDGSCSCKANVTGDKCIYCYPSLYPFPECNHGKIINSC